MRVRQGVEIATLTATTFAVCWVCAHVSVGSSLVAAIWPADALVAAYVLRRKLSVWGGLAVTLLAAAAMVPANLSVGRDLFLAVGFPLANVIGITAAVGVMRGASAPMSKTSDYVRFLGGAAFGAPLLSALVATGLAVAHDPQTNALQLLLRWAPADGMGYAILLPFALTIGPAWTRIFASRRRMIASLVCQLAVAAICFHVFFIAPMPFVVLALPFVMMSVFLSREAGAAMSMATVAGFGLVAAALGADGLTAAAGAVGRDPMLVAQLMVACMVLTVQPVTAVLGRLDAAIAELDSRRDTAEAQSRNKTKLLAHVSHEIRTPLSGVVTLAEMMRQGALGQLTPRQLDMITRIAESGAEIEALSRDLLDAASIQAGKTSLSKEIVEVSQALETAVAAASFRLRDYDATVEMGEGVGAGLSVVADPMRLRQMLMNLIINAAKYGGRPPIVRIDAVAGAAGTVRFTIDDNGPGIAPDRREDIFNAFERSGAETSEIDGAGVGLALVRELAGLQGGAVGVEDGVLGGACFWVALPRAERTAQAA